MTDASFLAKDVLSQAEDLKRGAYSAEELTKAYLAHIAQVDQTVHAYLTVTADTALATARESDRRRARGESRGILDGIPFALKDNICTKGIPTTCASRMLAGYCPPYHAYVTERLLSAGAILLGKLNMDEFAMGATTETSAMGATHHPMDLSRSPGGSSGGSAAAVAASMAAFTLGSDTGGSVRQPAAFCGLVGMKPTYGTVSRYGLVAYASSLEQIGPISRTVGDNAVILQAIAGHDNQDATSARRVPERYDADLRKGVRGLRIGVPVEYEAGECSADVRTAVDSAVETYRMLGAEIVSVSLPFLKKALAAYYILSSAEASSNLARFDGIRYGYRAETYADTEELYCRSRSEGFGKEVQRRILLGTFVLSAGYYEQYYQKALHVRAWVRRMFSEVFTRCDLIITPAVPTTAYLLGMPEKEATEMYRGDLYSVPANIAGIPALSLPCGTGKDGLPVGLQLMGASWTEPLLYRAGYALEQMKQGDAE